MIQYYCFLIVMTIIGAFASLFLKKASGSKSLIVLMKNGYLYLGIFLYILSAIINVLILKKLDYSVVLPLTSLTYIWTMVLSYYVLKENITKEKIIGVFLILAGAVCVAVN